MHAVCPTHFQHIYTNSVKICVEGGGDMLMKYPTFQEE